MNSSNSFKKSQAAIQELSKAVFRSSLSCAEELKESLNFPVETEKQERWIYMLFEFIYFFMHMISRAASDKLADSQRTRLLDELGSAVINPTVETILGHWPQSLKEGIRRDFYLHLNDAELEYSNCKELVTKDDPFSDTALFSRLAKNVAEVSGNSNNPETIMRVLELSVDSWKNMQLETLVEAALRGL